MTTEELTGYTNHTQESALTWLHDVITSKEGGDYECALIAFKMLTLLRGYIDIEANREDHFS